MCLDQGNTRGGDRVSGDMVTRTDVAPTLLWMECGACSGESMAILGAEGRESAETRCPDSSTTMASSCSGTRPCRSNRRSRRLR